MNERIADKTLIKLDNLCDRPVYKYTYLFVYVYCIYSKVLNNTRLYQGY